MAKRGDPAEQQRQRERDAAAREEILHPTQEVSLGMMVDLPEADLVGIFKGLKSLRSKFPAHAEEVIGRVQKMLGATEKEMAEGLKVRPRNDWKPNVGKVGGTGGMLADLAERVDQPADVRKMLRRTNPENYTPVRGGTRGTANRRGIPDFVGTKVPVPPQGPNAARAEKAAASAIEKVITKVETAIKNAPKQ